MAGKMLACLEREFCISGAGGEGGFLEKTGPGR